MDASLRNQPVNLSLEKSNLLEGDSKDVPEKVVILNRSKVFFLNEFFSSKVLTKEFEKKK